MVQLARLSHHAAGDATPAARGTHGDSIHRAAGARSVRGAGQRDRQFPLLQDQGPQAAQVRRDHRPVARGPVRQQQQRRREEAGDALQPGERRRAGGGEPGRAPRLLQDQAQQARRAGARADGRRPGRRTARAEEVEPAVRAGRGDGGAGRLERQPAGPHLQRRRSAGGHLGFASRSQHTADRAAPERLRPGAHAGDLADARPESVRAAARLPRDPHRRQPASLQVGVGDAPVQHGSRSAGGASRRRAEHLLALPLRRHHPPALGRLLRERRRLFGAQGLQHGPHGAAGRRFGRRLRSARGSGRRSAGRRAPRCGDDGARDVHQHLLGRPRRDRRRRLQPAHRYRARLDPVPGPHRGRRPDRRLRSAELSGSGPHRQDPGAQQRPGDADPGVVLDRDRRLSRRQRRLAQRPRARRRAGSTGRSAPSGKTRQRQKTKGKRKGYRRPRWPTASPFTLLSFAFVFCLSLSSDPASHLGR